MIWAKSCGQTWLAYLGHLKVKMMTYVKFMTDHKNRTCGGVTQALRAPLQGTYSV